MHISEGKLRLLLERRNEGIPDPASEQHLQACAHCREQLESLSTRARRVNEELDALATMPGNPMPADAAARRLRARMNMGHSQSSSWNRIFAPKYRAAWISAGLLIGLTSAFMFPAVQVLAGRFLSVFRVKQFSVVQVDPENLQKLDRLGSSSLLAQMISDTVKVETKGKPQEATNTAEASSLAGIQLKVPAALTEQPRWSIQPKIDITLYLDLPRIKAILEEAGHADIPLPEALNGSTVSINIPPIAAAFFGDCRQIRPEDAANASQTSLTPQRSCTVLTQLMAPSVTAPEDLDTHKLGLALLQLLGVPAEEAGKFSQSVDWTSTFVIPIPRNVASFEEVDVDGTRGTLIQTDSAKSGRPQRYLLVWTEDGIVYALNGIGSKADTLTIANSLQ